MTNGIEPKPSVELDWADALRPHALSTIGVALEHSPADAEILNRALGLAQLGRTCLVLLHVVDTPMTGVYGAETSDREADADQRYLALVVEALRERGHTAESVLLYGPDRSARLIEQLRRAG